ncbi:MAG: chemotaxis protein CheB, partial [Desulfobacteraceae bacterium]|nr:chemotaxis protein CheB [Desulfobacteraceae bacterium]
DYFVESLNSKCNLEVIEAEDKENIKAGKVYIAPGEYHLLVEKQRIFSLSVDELVCFSRPSIDVLFESAASAYGEQLVGVILTGANSDGSEGIKSIKKNNGLTIAQDPDTAEVNVMPLSAIATGCIDYIIPLEEIPPFINSLLEDNNGKNQH